MATAGDDLQEFIKLWAAQNPEIRTVSYLARKTGVDYNTISRAWTGKNPVCQTALAILNVVSSKADGLKYLKDHFPQAARFHEREFSTANVFSDHETLKPMLQDKMSLTLLALAYGGKGSKEHIQKAYGDLGIETANELAGAGRLRWDNGQLLPNGSHDFFTFEAKEDVIHACENIVDLSKGQHGYPVALIGSLTDDEHLKFKSIIREFCQATKELVYSSKGGGDHVIALATVYVNLTGRVEP